MGRTGRTNGWRHDRKKLWLANIFSGPRTGDQAPGRPSSRLLPRGATGGGENWSRGRARRSAPPCFPHNLLADTTRLAGCGGRLVGVLTLAPISQPILSELQAAPGTRPCGPERLKNKLKTRVPGKNFWFLRSCRCQVLPPGGALLLGIGVFWFPASRAACLTEAIGQRETGGRALPGFEAGGSSRSFHRS